MEKPLADGLVGIKRGIRLSLLVFILVAGSVFLLGTLDLSCELWTHVALSGAKKVGIRTILRLLHQSNLWELPVDRFKFLERVLKPGL